MLKDNLVMLRNIHGYSQEAIAEKIGISRQAYAKWETGATIPEFAFIISIGVRGMVRTHFTKFEKSGKPMKPHPSGQDFIGFL